MEVEAEQLGRVATQMLLGNHFPAIKLIQIRPSIQINQFHNNSLLSKQALRLPIRLLPNSSHSNSFRCKTTKARYTKAKIKRLRLTQGKTATLQSAIATLRPATKVKPPQPLRHPWPTTSPVSRGSATCLPF